MKRLFLAAGCTLLLACPGPKVDPDAGAEDSGLLDAGEDAGEDGGAADGGPADAGTFDAGPGDAGYVRCVPRDAGDSGGGRLRVLAGNLTSGNQQSWEPGEGQRILQGLAPDVALLQEWNIGFAGDVARRGWVDTNFGPGACFHLQVGGSIPNGVVSRWPILESGQWVDSQVTNRAFAWSRIDVPGPKDLWAVSIHLLTSNPTQRNLEANDLVAAINQVVPATDYLVIGGDLNTPSRTEAAMVTLGQVVRVSGPHPVDGANNPNTNAQRNQPYDWVMADPELFALQVPVRVGDAGYSAGLVFDSRVFTPLGDVAPVVSTDSAAFNMQHMAVVKDFLLP